MAGGRLRNVEKKLRGEGKERTLTVKMGVSIF